MAANKKPNLDTVTTINADGSHYKVQTADVSGRFTTLRRVVGYLLIIVYAALPWIPVKGHPAVFLDIANRSFHLFGFNLAIQDLWVFFFLVSGLGFTLFFVTSLLGRIWCGWTCPYTVFLDHVFRRIERLVEGDAPARKKLDNTPMCANKLGKRIIKHSLYILCSTVIAHVFVSYFISLKNLYAYMHHAPAEHMGSFGVVAFLSTVLYFCFAWFREQFCVVVCPYGRIQSALSDDNTMVIGYDTRRGEPRGKAKNPNNGDCIDCRRCVNVCPTGIDIRNGLQMECIGCAACIDACDDIMAKTNRLPGLIRYDSHNGLNGKKRKIIRPRIFAYLLLTLLGTGAFAFTVYKKARPFTVQITKMRGTPFQKDSTGVRNIYKVSMLNKRNEADKYDINLLNAPAWVKVSGTTHDISLESLEEKNYSLVVIAPADNYEGSFDFTIEVKSQADGSTVQQDVRFLGPNPYLYRKSLKTPSSPAPDPQTTR